MSRKEFYRIGTPLYEGSESQYVLLSAVIDQPRDMGNSNPEGTRLALPRYAVAPLQHGMLYHSLASPGTGVDIEQIRFRLAESVRIEDLTAAWQAVIGRHPILRAGFDWRNGDEPQQVVHDAVDLRLEVLDWRAVLPEGRDARFEEFCLADRLTDFDMEAPPLMRLRLMRYGDADYTGLWTFHHALLDGRSFPLVLGEVFELYDAGDLSDIVLPIRRPYADFVDAVRERDLTRDREFWTSYLAGVEAATGIGLPVPDAPADRPADAVELQFDRHDSDELRAFADTTGCTLNTVIQAAWMLLLSHYSQRSDVVIGVTRACRHSSVGEADSMVGLLINTVPMRVDIDPTMLVPELLAAVRHEQLAVTGLRAHAAP